MKRLSILVLLFGIIALLIYFKNDMIVSIQEYRTASKTSHTPNIISLRTSKFLTPMPTRIPTPTITKRIAKKSVIQPSTEWGVAKEIEEGTYTIKVGSDASMGSPQEVFAALNAYRATNSRSALTWDDGLGKYAQSRADYINSIQTTDKHAGFNHFLEQEDGFNTLGFYRLGENSYYGGPLSGTHVIEWVFAKSPGHDANQKDTDWTHVGIGVTNSTVNLNFGGSKI